MNIALQDLLQVDSLDLRKCLPIVQKKRKKSNILLPMVFSFFKKKGGGSKENMPEMLTPAKIMGDFFTFLIFVCISVLSNF